MDAATHEELNALRRRAYALDADIDTDAAAWARLAELEELALPPAPRDSVPPELVQSSPPAVPGPGVVAQAADAPAADAPAAERESPRTNSTGRWVLALAATASVAVVAVGALITSGGVAPLVPDAAVDPGGAADRGDAIRVPVMILESTGEYIDLSTIETAPDFPVRGEMAWAQPLGEHYGWSLWIGGAEVGRRDQSCLLLTDGTATRARCVALDARTQGELIVTLPYERIPGDVRPAQMTSDHSVQFLWSTGGFVSIALVDAG